MHIITVDTHKTKILEAIGWACNEFGSDSFDISNLFPNNFWGFEFKKSEHAMLFALRWQR